MFVLMEFLFIIYVLLFLFFNVHVLLFFQDIVNFHVFHYLTITKHLLELEVSMQRVFPGTLIIGGMLLFAT